jgi:hypothetical protein
MELVKGKVGTIRFLTYIRFLTLLVFLSLWLYRWQKVRV